MFETQNINPQLQSENGLTSINLDPLPQRVSVEYLKDGEQLYPDQITANRWGNRIAFYRYTPSRRWVFAWRAATPTFYQSILNLLLSEPKSRLLYYPNTADTFYYLVTAPSQSIQVSETGENAISFSIEIFETT